MLLAFWKPYGVLSRFTSDGSAHGTLAGFGFPKGVYSLGRLDADSEGLLLLSDEAGLSDALLDPVRQHPREYAVQVEGSPTPAALAELAAGVVVQGRRTLPAQAVLLLPEPIFPPRVPPIRTRKSIPTAWISLTLVEGKNRQVRRMTAAVGHPTLRLVRTRIGHIDLSALTPGQFRTLTEDDARTLVHMGASDAPRAPKFRRRE